MKIAGWCNGSTLDSASKDARSIRAPATIISIFLVCAIIVSFFIFDTFADASDLDYEFGFQIMYSTSSDAATWTQYTIPAENTIGVVAAEYIRIDGFKVLGQPSGHLENTEGTLYFTFRFCGAQPVTDMNGTYNLRYAKQGGNLATYYMTATTSPATAIKFSCSTYAGYNDINEDYYNLPAANGHGWAFTQLNYTCYGQVGIWNNYDITFTCSSPPIFHFWLNQASNFVALYPCFFCDVTFYPNNNKWFDIINTNLLGLSQRVSNIGSYCNSILNELESMNQNLVSAGVAFENMVGVLDGIKSDTTNMNDNIQQEHDIISDYWGVSGLSEDFDEKFNSDAGSDGFDMLDDLDLDSVAEYNPSAIVQSQNYLSDWFSQATKDSIDAVGGYRNVDDPIVWFMDDWENYFNRFWGDDR